MDNRGLLVCWLWLPLILCLPIIFFIDQTDVWKLAILPTWLIVRWLIQGRPFPATPLNYPLALLGLMLFINLFVTLDPALSLTKHVGLAYGFALYFAIYDAITTTARWRIALCLFVLAGSGLSAVGLLGVPFEAYTKFPFLSNLTAHLPTFLLQGNPINANMIGGIMTLILPLTIAFFVAAYQQQHGRLLATMLLIVTSIMLIISQSRGAILGVGFTLVWIIPLMVCSRRKWRKLLLGSTILSIIIIVSVMVILQNSDLLLTRLEIWDRAILLIEDTPLTGVGMNMFRHIMPLVYPLFLTSPTQDIAHAHNIWLTVAIDLGLPALVAYCALLWCTFFHGIKHIHQTAVSPLLPLGLLGGLAAHLLYGTWDAIALGAKPGFLFWVLLALITVQKPIYPEQIMASPSHSP